MENGGFQPEPEYGLPPVGLRHREHSQPQTTANGLPVAARHDDARNSKGFGISPIAVALPIDDSDEDEAVKFEALDWEPSSPFSRGLIAVQTFIDTQLTKRKKMVKTAIVCALFAAYNAYFVGTVVLNRATGDLMEWCDDVGFLIILTGIVYWSLFYYFILKKYAGKAIYHQLLAPAARTCQAVWKFTLVRSIFFLALLGGLVTFLVLDTKSNRRRLTSAAGVPTLLLCGLIISKHPARVIWRHIVWGTGLQFLFGLMILRWPFGESVLLCVSGKIEKFLSYGSNGAGFVYGFTATGFTVGGVTISSTFAFGVLPVIFYFSFVVAMLYHLGTMTWVVSKIGWLLQVSMGTTACESMNAAANIFLGQTEAPLVVKPFLNDMTNSELHAVMTGGFATIAGTVMGAFISFGVSASHLLSASFMSAPAALALAKLIYPETKVSRTTSDKIYELTSAQKSKKSNFLDAATEGASQGVHLVANIIANLIAIVGFVALVDAMLAWFGSLIGFHAFSFHWLLSKLFYPFAFVIGVDHEELEDVAYLLGLKTVVNEFVAYERLTAMKLSPRTKVIMTYALCCFANFSSIGVQLGGIGAMAPRRRKDMSKVIWRAFVAGNFAALMTACIAGTLTDEMGYAEWIKLNGTRMNLA